MTDVLSTVRTIAPKLTLMFLLWCGSARASDTVTTQLYRGNLTAALQSARSEAQAAPDDLDAQELYIDLLLASGQAYQARTELESAVKQRPTDPNAHYLLGRAQVDAQASIDAYERALKLDPDHARSHMGMGAVFTSAGRLEEAERAYSEALRRDGTLGEAWLGLIRIQILSGAPRARALDLARRGMAAAPEEPGLYLSAAQLDPENARSILAKAAEASGDARIHTRLAELRLAAGETDAATVSARRALAIDPGDAEAERVLVYARTIEAGKLDLPGLAAVLDARDAMAEDPAKAAAALDGLAEKYPHAAIVFLARAEAQKRLGRDDAMIEALALALQRDPELTDAQAAFGLALVGADRHAEAIPWLVKAVRTRPWDPDLVRSLGIAQRHGGNVPAAVQTLRAAYRIRSWDVPTVLAYADALGASGEPEAAYAIVRDALQRSSDPSLAAAFVIVAKNAGHVEIAADFLEDLGRKSGSTKLVELANRMRAAN